MVQKFTSLLGALFCSALLITSVVKLNNLLNININILALQTAAGVCAAFYLLKPVRVNRKLLLISSVFFLIIILAYNFLQPVALITNPLIPTFLILLVFATVEFRQRDSQVSDAALLLLFFFVTTLQFFENITFSPQDTGTGRLYGQGSATSYAVTAAMFCFYLLREYSLGKIRLLSLFILIAVPIWSIALVQSRGVVLSIAIIVIINNAKNMRGILMLSTIFAPALFFVFQSEVIVSNIELLSRIDYRNYENLQHFTSGRIQTQAAIVAEVGRSAGSLQAFFGIEGINGLKSMVERGFFFPHLDLLYFTYDMGFIGAFFYILLSIFLLIKFRFSQFILLYFISSLHTNMVLNPGLLVLSVIMALRYQRPISSNIHRRHGLDFRNLKASEVKA